MQDDLIALIEPVARVIVNGGGVISVYGYSRRSGSSAVEVLGEVPTLTPAEARRLGSALFLAAQEATR